MEKKEGIIDKPLAKASNYKKQIIAHKKTKTTTRAAITHYKVLKQKENWALLEVTPKTGRTHQIRVHLTSIGYPIVGDKIYQLKNKESLKCQRQLLHALELYFELYGQKYAFKAELPEDFRQFISNID
jgi:23S rRNA pseudouridine1911/1915/1917 synthase